MSYTHNESIANTKARESPTFPLSARTENAQLPILISESLVLLFNYVENTGIFLREKPLHNAMNQKQRLEIFDRLAAAIPDPTTELNYSSAFELLIAVVLSAQATDKGVNKATTKLFPVANTPSDILALGETGLKEYIKTIGLFNSKAAHIITLCKQLLDKHNGQVPQTREELEGLAGVGRKTANVILNTAFGQHTIAVDTHIFRVANRTGLAPGKNVREVERKLEKCVPKKHIKDAHHLLILHGRYTCIARKPRCSSCVIEDLCEYQFKTGYQDEGTERKAKPLS